MRKKAGLILLSVFFFLMHMGISHANDAICTFKAGDISLVRLADKAGGIPPTVFIGADKSELDKLLQGGLCPSTFLTFLIKSPTDLILVDTGNGEANQGKTLTLLKQLGVSKEDITKVFLTHMHGDHVQGLFSGDKKTYPRAEVYVEQSEYRFWSDRKNLSQVPKMAACFDYAEKLGRLYKDKIHLFTAGEKLLPWITSVAMPGHTEGHTGFLVTKGEKKLLLAGDFLHCLPVQTAYPDVTVIWDSDQNRARKSRKAILERVANTETIVLGGHFSDTGAVRFTEKAGKYSYSFVQPDAH